VNNFYFYQNQKSNPMKKLTTKIQLILFTALLAGFTSCSDDDDAGMITEESETIADFVASEEDYSSLAEALDRTGLTATLDAEGTYTVFAPNNAAFEAYLGGTAVADVPVEDLTQILLNHVLAVEARASSLATGYVNNLATYADTDANLSMYINVDSDVVTINGGSELEGGANVTATDFEFSNGIVHTVDAVIALPTVATFAVADPTFTQLETALTADASFSFVNTLTSAGTFTVFAPTNDAFADLLAELEISGFDDLDTSVLAAALSLHVVNGANVRAEDLTTGTVTTLGGAIEVDASNATLTDANGRVSTIVVTDVQASNGVVHAIDTVLLPGL